MKKALILFLLATSSLQAAQYIVFDWGGVLGHTTLQVHHELQKSFQLDAPSAHTVLKRYCSAMERGRTSNFWERWARHRGKKLPPNFHNNLQHSIRRTIVQYPKMKKLAADLRGLGYRTVILSNINHWRAVLIRKMGGYTGFRPVFLSYQMGLQKPNPRIFTVMLQKLHTTPDNVIFIDDLPPNIAAAKKLGIDAIHCHTHAQVVDELIKRKILPPTYSK